ncbi:hypothetical protein GJAV_G00029700 [Gymnothorax javanicus]|nr:hypothetical protein GJAV_G00029700 [Gymnothorax javanicus]
MKEPSRTREEGDTEEDVTRQGYTLRTEADTEGTSESMEVLKDPQSDDCQPATGESSEPSCEFVAGSNGLDLSKRRRQEPLCRTTGSPSGPSLVGQDPKTPSSPSSAGVQHPAPGGGECVGDVEGVSTDLEAKKCMNQDSAPPATKHRARKTMARSTSIQTVLQAFTCENPKLSVNNNSFLNREQKESVCEEGRSDQGADQLPETSPSQAQLSQSSSDPPVPPTAPVRPQAATTVTQGRGERWEPTALYLESGPKH